MENSIIPLLLFIFKFITEVKRWTQDNMVRDNGDTLEKFPFSFYIRYNAIQLASNILIDQKMLHHFWKLLAQITKEKNWFRCSQYCKFSTVKGYKSYIGIIQ